jgi:DNA-binding transcriptional LysR family regulator
MDIHQEPDFNQLKKLWTLKLVVEAGSLRQAATRTKVSVSAVSQSLTTLERNFGQPLFVRKDRKLFPTTFCRELLGTLEPAFKTFADLRLEGAVACEVPKMAWLDFGIAEPFAADIVPSFVARMRRKLPDMKLKMRIGKSADLLRLVKSNQLCMALVAVGEPLKGVSVYPLVQDRLGLYFSANHRPPASHAAAACDSGVASILPGREGYPTYYSRYLKALTKTFRPTLTSDSYETLYSIATSGVAPAILPSRMANRDPAKLREIPWGNDVRNSETLGRFDICLISEKNCDPVEDLFLISELKSLL